MRFVTARLAAGVALTAAAVVCPLVSQADIPSTAGEAPGTARLLDVPFVPQSRTLCGGAALAMVMRYWGAPAVLAEDFADRLVPGGTGIRSDAMVEAVRERGWTAFPATGTISDLEGHVARGRPIIVLLDATPGALHYVVVVGRSRGSVIVHDPALGPRRSMREDRFERAWAGSGHWCLLVLPPQPVADTVTDPAPVADPAGATALEGCDALVEDGIRRARDGDAAGAEQSFLAAQALCPTSSAPARELAGLRFGAADWKGASRSAEHALALDPGDSLASRLLAGSRFLDGDTEGALRAWNRLSEPRTDLTRIEGLMRTRYSAVARQLDLRPGQLLTPRTFLRARRRLEELPAQSAARLSLRPLSGGSAQVDVAVLERPLLFAGPWDAGRTAVRAVVERQVEVGVASPTGNGELWTADWRWWDARPRVSLALSIPAAGGHPGIWRVEGIRERQSYAPGTQSTLDDPTPVAVVSEARRRTALSFADWVSATLRLEGGVALDRWSGRGSHLSLEGKAETRSAGDRLTLGAELAAWNRLEGGASFAAGAVLARWSSDPSGQRGWRARAGASSATSDAPRSLWSGAGTGSGRAPLLRAHPLLEGGVLAGRAFGRTLVHGGAERQAWAWTLRPVRVGWALFIDAARPWDSLSPAPVPWQIDAGAGLRLAGMGTRGQFRIDVARGLEDGNVALSVGWEAR